MRGEPARAATGTARSSAAAMAFLCAAVYFQPRGGEQTTALAIASQDHKRLGLLTTWGVVEIDTKSINFDSLRRFASSVNLTL